MSFISRLTGFFSRQPTSVEVAKPASTVEKGAPKEIWALFCDNLNLQSLSALGCVNRFTYHVVKEWCGKQFPQATKVFTPKQLSYLAPLQQAPKVVVPDFHYYKYGKMEKQDDAFIDEQNKLIVRKDCIEICPSHDTIPLPPGASVLDISRGKRGELVIWVEQNGRLFNLLNPSEECPAPGIWSITFDCATKEWRYTDKNGTHFIDSNHQFHGPFRSFLVKPGYSPVECSYDFVLAHSPDEKKLVIFDTSTKKQLASMDLPDGTQHFGWLSKGKLLAAVAKDTLMIWDINGTLVATHKAPRQIECVKIDDDGSLMINHVDHDDGTGPLIIKFF